MSVAGSALLYATCAVGTQCLAPAYAGRGAPLLSAVCFASLGNVNS